MAAGTNQKLRQDLLKNPDNKIGGRGVVHGNGDDAAVGAAEERGNPCRRVRAPDHNPIALANSAGREFASEPESQGRHFGVSPAYKPVSDALGVGLFFAEALKVCQIIGDAGSHGLSVNHSLREGDLLDLAVNHNIVEKSGSWCSHKGEPIGQGRENARQFLKNNKDVMAKLETEVRKALGPIPSQPVAAVQAQGAAQGVGQGASQGARVTTMPKGTDGKARR